MNPQRMNDLQHEVHSGSFPPGCPYTTSFDDEVELDAHELGLEASLIVILGWCIGAYT